MPVFALKTAPGWPALSTRQFFSQKKLPPGRNSPILMPPGAPGWWMSRTGAYPAGSESLGEVLILATLERIKTGTMAKEMSAVACSRYHGRQGDGRLIPMAHLPDYGNGGGFHPGDGEQNRDRGAG